jgi:acyl dehydratase
MSLFLEDYVIGSTESFGSHTFTAGAIQDFASRYDPQTPHLAADPVASPWHVAAGWMQLMVRRELAMLADFKARGLPIGRMGPSPGITGMRWPALVRAGDCVTYSSTITRIEQFRGRPKWGIMGSSNEGTNQRGERVLEFKADVLVERRPVADGRTAL